MASEIVLAIDTCTQQCSVAVLKDGRCVEKTVREERQHGKCVLALVEACLQEAACTLADVAFIAFTQGPGSFTGMRIGLGVVQGLALSHNIPVMPISTLAVLAFQAGRHYDYPYIAAAIDARMQEVYVGFYEVSASKVQLIGREAVLPPEKVILPEEQQWLGAGNGWAYMREASLCNRDEEIFPQAKSVAELAKMLSKYRVCPIPVEEAHLVYLRNSI